MISGKKNNVSQSQEVSILSSGVNIIGDIESEGNLRIDGKVKGDIRVKENITLGESSNIKGNVTAKNITLSGKLEGIATASDRIVLESKAVLIGELVSKILVIEEGAKFDGSSRMSEKVLKSETQN